MKSVKGTRTEQNLLKSFAGESQARMRYTFFAKQAKEEGSPQYCLADFIAPKSENIADYCGAFAVTAGIGVAELVAQYKADNNDYKAIMLEALADRLAEAFAEKLHEEVRRNYWGYTKEENLSKEQLISVKYQGIRPAAGYPACPEHSEKAEIFRLLNAEKNTGITLTEHYSMYPTAAVSGQYFAHPQAVYFGIEKVGRDQVEDYARRKDVAQQFVEKFIPANLNYK